MTMTNMVNQRGKDSNGDESTPLMAAGKNEHFNIVKYLIEEGKASPVITDSNGSMPLHLAARFNKESTKIVKILMNSNSINLTNDFGYTPLCSAYCNRSDIKDDIVAMIKAKGGHVIVARIHEALKNSFPGGTPLVCACEKGCLEDVKLLLTGHDGNGGSNGNYNNITLKEYVNQVGKTSNGDESTPLMAAITNKHTDIKMYLVEHGADLHKAYKEEFPDSTPLVCASEEGRLGDVKLLITGRNDANGSNGDNNNMTLKEYVNQVGKTSKGYHYTPLMIAAEKEHFQVVKYLIEQGEADPNIAREAYGNNALHFVASHNKKDTEVIELLLTHMSLNSINKKTSGGYTPLDKAYEYNDSPIKQEIIALLRSKGGKANYFDANGRRVARGLLH